MLVVVLLCKLYTRIPVLISFNSLNSHSQQMGLKIGLKFFGIILYNLCWLQMACDTGELSASKLFSHAFFCINFPIFQYFACFSRNVPYNKSYNVCTKSSNFLVFSKVYQYLCSEFSIKDWQIRILEGYGSLLLIFMWLSSNNSYG